LEVELLNHGARAFAELSPLQRKDATEALQILDPFEGATLFKAARYYADFSQPKPSVRLVRLSKKRSLVTWKPNALSTWPGCCASCQSTTSNPRPATC
jgi:hypothetical protein